MNDRPQYVPYDLLATLNISVCTIRVDCHLNVQPSYNTKPGEILAVIYGTNKVVVNEFTEEPEKTANTLDRASRWIADPEYQKKVELLEQANICKVIGVGLKGIAAGYSLCSGSYTNFEEIHKSVSPTKRFMEVAVSGAHSAPNELYKLSDLIVPIGGTVLGAFSLISNPISWVSFAGDIFYCLSIVKRIQLDRINQKGND